MQITNAAARLAARLESKARRSWNPDLHPRDSKGRFIETGGIARLWGGGMARVLRALGGRNVLVENLATHQQSTIHASRLTMVARPDGTAPTKSKKKVRDEDERRLADGRRGTGVDDDDAGDQGDTPDDPHDSDDQGEDIGEDVDGEDLGAGPEPEDDEEDDEPKSKPAAKRQRRDPNRRFKTLDDVRAHWASGKLRPFTDDKKAQASHNEFTAELLSKLDKPQLSRNGHFVVGQMTVRNRAGVLQTGWGVMHAETGVRLTLADRKGEALEFANNMVSFEVDGKPIDWNAPDALDRLNSPEGLEKAGRMAAESRARFAQRAAKKREGAAARTKPAPATPAQPQNPAVQAAQQIADRSGAPASNIAVGHVGPKQSGDERGRPRNDAELREFWKRGGSDDTPEAQRDDLRKFANDPNINLYLADHRGFAILEHTDRDDAFRFEVRAVGTARPFRSLGPRGIHSYGNFADRETADRFTLYLGSNLRDQDGRTVDWGQPRLNAALNSFRDKDGQRSNVAIWQLAGQFDRERGATDSPAARFGRRRDEQTEEQRQDPETAPETPNTGIPGEDVTPQPADSQQRDDQEEQQSERVQGAGEGVLGDVPAGGAGEAGGDDAAGDVLRSAERGDRGTDRGVPGRVPGGDGARGGLQGRDGVDQHGDAAGEGEGPARDAVQPGEGAGHGGEGDADREPAEDRSRVAFGSSEQEQTAPQYEPPEDGRSVVPSGVAARVKANIAAIEVLRRLQDENRPATAAEQETLARWSGWGATPQVFVDTPKPEFEPLQRRLRELLSDDEYEAAKDNTLNAHYTDPAIAQQVWQAVKELGFDGGNVLEPGSGSGNFIGYAPENAHMTGVELDPITAGIAKALYPQADIRNEGFEKTRAANGTFDLTVGNVPFGDYQVVDLRHNKGGHNIHNHFILKSLDLTRPGGLVAVVTSRYTMDGSKPRSEDARMEMARKADLVGAIRLPTGAHRRTAGTDVVTDLLIFRRREKDKEFTSGRTRKGDVKPPEQRKQDDPPMWVHSVQVNDLPGQDPEDKEAPQVHINPYFLDHPRNVIGDMHVGNGMYGPGELRVHVAGDLNEELGHTLKRVVARAKDARLTYKPDTGERRKVEMLSTESDRPDGHVQLEADGTFTQVRDGMVHPFEVPKTQIEEAQQLLGVRDSLKALVREEARPDADEALIETLRADLKARYDKYHAKFGSLNRFEWADRKATDPDTGEQVVKAYRKRPQMGGLLTKDPTMAVILSLDTYDENNQTSTPAAIFTKRQARHRTIAERASRPEDAMAIVLEQRGTLDLEALADVMGVDPQVARERLLAARSTDPETGDEYPLVFEPHDNGNLVPAAEYLSGNVREKLEQAQALAANDSRYEINVKHLEDVLPEEISPGEIDAPMGASWLGRGPIQEFLRDKLGSDAINVSYQGGSMWRVDAPDAVKNTRAARRVWGTEDFNAIKLAEAILTNGRIRVTYRDDDGKTYVDEDATAAAQTKAEEMREEFQDWLWATQERTERVKKLYNDLHNNLALRSYDGQRRTMPGLAEWFKPHAHQHSAVARMVSEPAVLLAHEVGAGKTAEMTMGVMELRRLGLVNKAAIVVPNHMLNQFRDEFAELYPESAANGRILAASSDDLQGRKRREFIARVATGDYDAVILTQNAFESIPMRPEVQLEYIKREKEQLEEALKRQKREDEENNPSKRTDSRMVKEIRNRLKKLEAKITAKVEAQKDTAGLYFEDTGIDYVVVDEAHHYKNLSTNSTLPGAAIEGSNRASDLDMKLEYLRKTTKSGRVVTFATATPISNSITEAHTMLRYLRPDLLEKAKVRNFDDFASTFGKVVNGTELAADGSGFREVSRFAAFRNMPELLRIWRTVADVKNSDDLAEYLDTPDVAGGKAVTISVEPTEGLLAYMDQIAARARAVKRGDVEPTVDNMLKINSDGRKVSLDPRMVGIDEQGAKLPAAADNIARIYADTKDAVYPTSKNNPAPHETPGGLQIVFLDMGTPVDPGKSKKKKGKNDGPADLDELGQSKFPAYQEMKDLLIERGVPAEKIRFIHEAKNDAEKARLFADARNGKIAVLLGSTSKMGVGTNVQLRATALHHLDCPWRPADLEQRNGRIIRQGNSNPEVAIFQYVTEGSFDGFAWQTVARKAKFIRQIMKGNLTERTIEDIPDGVFNAEQVTAISTGNPYLLEQANVKVALGVLTRKRKGHMRTIEGYKSTIHAAEKLREKTDELVTQLRGVIARKKNTRGDDFNATIGTTDFTKRDEAAKALATAAKAVLRQGKENPYKPGGHSEIVIGKVGNVEITAKYRTTWDNSGRVHLVDIRIPDVPQSLYSYDERALNKDSTLPITRIEDKLADVEKMIVRAESRLRQEERAAATARERVDRPFEQAGELEAAERRSKLIAAIIREQGREVGSEDAAKEKRSRMEALEHQLREARIAAGEDAADVDDPAAEQDTDLLPRTPAPPSISTDEKGRPRITWPDAEARKAAKERKRREKQQRAREERGETTLDPEQVRDDLESLREDAPAPEADSSTPAQDDQADAPATDQTTPEAEEGTTTLNPAEVRSELDSLQPDTTEGDSGAPEAEATAQPDATATPESETSAPESETSDDEPEAPAPESDQEEAEQTDPAADAPAGETDTEEQQPADAKPESEETENGTAQNPSGEAPAPKTATPTAEPVRPFTNDAERKNRLAAIEGVQGNVQRTAESTWGRDGTPDTVRSLRDAVFEAIAAHETGDFEDAAGSLAAARDDAEALRARLTDDERQRMEAPLASFTRLVDDYLAQHAVTVEKRRREDAQRDRIERQAAEQFRDSLRNGQQGGANNTSNGDSSTTNEAPPANESSRDSDSTQSQPEPTPSAEEDRSPAQQSSDQPSEQQASRPEPSTPPADMTAEQLADAIDETEDQLSPLTDSTDPVDLAMRRRLERRLWELENEERGRWEREPEYDSDGKLIQPSRKDIISDRLAGYDLNDAEVQGLVSRVEDLPEAKEGGYSDEEWERISAEASAREDYPPTDEQNIIIEGAARRGLHMAVMALAGTGKSSTLKMLSHRMPGKSIVYLAFNRSVAAEAREAQARGEYAKNMLASTANAYAARVADRRLNDRLPSSRVGGFKKLSAQQIADRMRWYDTVKAGSRDITPGGAATVAERMIREWAKSADAEMGPQHVKAGTEEERRDLFNAVKPLADRMWANLTDPEAGDPDRDLTMDFDYIVKHWALSGYKLDADVLFWDEAQDVNPVMEGVVRAALDQGVQVVAVGDSNQAIYGFRGASDALAKLPVDARATLTQSFRFGPAVADVGNRFLRLLGTRMRLKGYDRKQSRIGQLQPGDESMVIARTNAGVALAAVQALTAGRTVAVSGGVKALQEFVQAANALAAGEDTDHAELARFNGKAFDDIVEEVKTDPDLQQLASLFNLLEKHGDDIEALLASGSRPAATELVGDRVWVRLDWNDPKANDLKRWLGDGKNNGVGKLLYDPATRRYFYEPGKREVPWKTKTRSGVHKIDNKLSLEEAQKRIDAHLADLYPQDADGDGKGRLVPEHEPHDVLVTTAHKAKGLESERVRIADDFKGPEEKEDGSLDWDADTAPSDEALRVAYVAVTRATEVLDPGSLGWVFRAVRDEDPTLPPKGEYRRDFELGDLKQGDQVDFLEEDGTPNIGVISKIDPPLLTVLSTSEEPGIGGKRQEISPAQVQRRNGEARPLLPVASDDELNNAITEGRYGSQDTVTLDREAVRSELGSLQRETPQNTNEPEAEERSDPKPAESSTDESDTAVPQPEEEPPGDATTDEGSDGETIDPSEARLNDYVRVETTDTMGRTRVDEGYLSANPRAGKGYRQGVNHGSFDAWILYVGDGPNQSPGPGGKLEIPTGQKIQRLPAPEAPALGPVDVDSVKRGEYIRLTLPDADGNEVTHEGYVTHAAPSRTGPRSDDPVRSWQMHLGDTPHATFTYDDLIDVPTGHVVERMSPPGPVPELEIPDVPGIDLSEYTRGEQENVDKYREWAGVWANPAPDGPRNALLDRVTNMPGSAYKPLRPEDASRWIGAAGNAFPLDQFDENTRHLLAQYDGDQREFLAQRAASMREATEAIAGDFRAESRQIMLPHLATRSGMKEATEKLNARWTEDVERIRQVVPDQIAAALADADRHGLTEQQVKDFLTGVAGGDDPEQNANGLAGAFPEVRRSLIGARDDVLSYYAAFHAWGGDGDDQQFAGYHHYNTRRGALGAEPLPAIDPKSGTGPLIIGEAELPKGMRWTRLQNLQPGDFYRPVHSRRENDEVFDGLGAPHIVINLHADGKEGRPRTRSLSTGSHTEHPGDWVIQLTEPEPSLRKRASAKRRDKWVQREVEEDNRKWEAAQAISRRPEGEAADLASLKEGERVRVRGSNEFIGGTYVAEGDLLEPPERARMWRGGKQVDGWRLHLSSRGYAGDHIYVADGEDDEWAERLSPEGTNTSEDNDDSRAPSSDASEDATGADTAPESETLRPDQAEVGDYVRAETQNTAGNTVAREGHLLAPAKKVTATRNKQRVKAWRLHLGREGEQPSRSNGVTILADDTIERLPAPAADLPEAREEHTNTLGWKGPKEDRETVGEHDGKPVEVGELHIQGDSVGRAVYLDGRRIGRLHGERGAWRAEHDRHGSLSSWITRWSGEPDDPTARAAQALARVDKDGVEGPGIRFNHDRTVSQEEAERRIAEHIDPRTGERLPDSDSSEDADREDDDANDRAQDSQDDQDNEEDTNRRDRNRRSGDRDGGAPDETSGGDGPGGVPDQDGDPDDEENDGPDDAEESDDEQRRDRRRRRDRDQDRDRGERNGGAPSGGLPNLPGRDRDRDRNRGDRDRSSETGAPSLDGLKNRYRSGDTPTPTGADPQEHADYLRRLADNDTLTLSPGGGLITWSDDDGSTWQFGHAASGVHLAGWEANGEQIGGRDGALRLADAYEQLQDENGNAIDWAAPELDAQTLRSWHDEQGNHLGAAIDQARQDVIDTAPGYRRDGQGDADDSAAETDRRGTSGTASTGGQQPAGAADSTTVSSPEETAEDAADAQRAAADSQYTVNATHGNGRRGGTVDGRRVPTAEEMKQYETGSQHQGIISEEGERALFGSPERMRELASEAFVPTPRMRLDHDGQIWRNGRLIGNLSAIHERSGSSYEEWWSQPPFATDLTKFHSREAAIAHLVLRDKERGEPDLSVVHPDLAFTLGHTAISLGFPAESNPFRGLETLADNPQDLERYYALRGLLDQLGKGITPSGNVADDLAHLHDELRWLDATHYKHQPVDLKEKHILGPGWLADEIREYLDVLRPEDPRAQHHEASKNRAAQQFLNELVDNGGLDNAERVPITEVRQGDVVRLDGRITGKYPGYTGARTGYVVSEPKKVTYKVDGTRYKGLRITVSKDLFDGVRHGMETDTFVIPADSRTALRLAHAEDVDLPVDQHRYGRQIGEAPRTEIADRGAPDSGNSTGERTGNAADAAAPPAPSPDGGNADAAQPADRPAAPAAPAGNAPAQPDEAPAGDRPGRSEGTTGSRRPAEPTSTSGATPEAPAAPEPVGGRPAEWVQVSDLQLRDLVRIDGTTKQGRARTLAGYVVGGPEEIAVTRKGRANTMYRVLVADTPDARTGSPVWVPLDAAAARATRDDADQFEGSPQTGADSDVLTGRIADSVPTDASGNGLFPGSVVTDDDGREGVVTGASANSVRVQFGDDRTDNDHAPSSLTVTDGGAARSPGWTPDGRRVLTGNVVGDRDGSMLGTVESVDGDTATVATPDGMTDMSIADLRVIGDTADSDGDHKVNTVEPTAAGKVQEGDVLVRETPNGPSTARVTHREEEGGQAHLDLEDTTTGETDQLSTASDTEVQRAVGADGNPPELGPEDAPDSGGEITSREPAPAVDPVTGPTVDPQLSPEERDAITDRGQTPNSDPDAQQGAARIANDLPVTPQQATALAEELREGADSATPEGRAAKRAADHLDAAAGNEPGDAGQAEPGTIGAVGEGDTIVLPDEFDPETTSAYRVVQIQEAPGGLRVLTIEDGDGMRFKRTLASSEALYLVPEPKAPTADDAEQRDPNPTPDVDRLRSDYTDAVVRAVIDNAIQGTTTPGSIHQLRQQIAEQLTPEAMRAAMRRARNGALAAITDAGIEGDERDELVNSLRKEAATARTDAVRAALRTVDDLEPLDGESEEDTARRAADLLRLIPEALLTRSAEAGDSDGDSRVNDAVTRHADDAVGEALQAAADSGDLLTPERRNAIVQRLAARMDATRNDTARQIAAALPADRRPGILPHIVAALAAIARMVIALVAAFLKALVKAWQRSREGLRRMRERIARFRRGLMQRMRSWPEARRLRRVGAAAALPQLGDGLALGDRVAHWARLLPAPGRFGQVSRRARWYRPASRSSLAAGQLPEVQDGVRWTMDRAVDGGPGPQALRHLAAVRAAGQDVDADVVARLAAAAPELGDDPHGTVRHATAYADTAERRLRDLIAAAAGGAPDADLEIVPARVEAQAARQEATRLQRAYAAALPGAVRDTLAEVREMGPGTTATLVTTQGSDPDAVRALTGIAQFVPREWLSPTEARFIAARSGDAGGYDPGSRTATVADLGDDGRRTAAHALLAHLQQHYPDLLAAQEAFHFTRTHSGRVGARRRTSLDRILARLFRGTDQGDTGDLVPLGLGTLFSGDWYEDDDLRAFLLGLLATR
ncbi:UvrD-helicase domain-containing protein [Streptomyces bottropensis]|uniref:UvrD-helicase domain-containing protein n=1 Tax=Streptomyces bottropensis TaxID=42235 RepID=UPI00369B2428